MSKLIKLDAIVEDVWTLLPAGTGVAQVPPVGPVIVPWSLWQAAREALQARGSVGVWLAPTDDPDALAADVDALPLIAIEFPKFGDGRGFSSARLLRDLYGFEGELRAFGDVFRDQLFYMAECGFDAFVVRPDLDPEKEVAGLAVFDRTYARSTRTPRPWFQARERFLASLPPETSLE